MTTMQNIGHKQRRWEKEQNDKVFSKAGRGRTTEQADKRRTKGIPECAGLQREEEIRGKSLGLVMMRALMTHKQPSQWRKDQKSMAKGLWS